ncbi:hypothetical protein PG985_003018 [Apiospora marii]|uniref:uncharacterized protein n=1 Tax=Apiospora marii TaxID=335849 RepID=UPI00313061AC
MSESEESEGPSSISSFDSGSSYDSAPRLPRTKNRRANPCTLFMRLPAELIGTAPHCSDGYKRDENGALFRKKIGKPGRHRFHKHSPWALSRVCRTVHAEVAPLLDAIDIADIHFEIQQFTEAEMRRWVTLPSANMTGVERVSRMRQWDIKAESSNIGRRKYRTLKSDLGESAA